MARPIDIATHTRALTADGSDNLVVTNELQVSTIDTADSSAITVVPAATFNSDVTVENDLVANGNVTASAFFGDGSNLTGISTTTTFVDLTDTDVASQASNTLVKYNGANYVATSTSEDSSGNVTITGQLNVSTIDTTDSSAISVTPATTFNSDVTVENSLTVSNDVNVGTHIDFDSTTYPGHALYQEGRVWYDSTHKTLNYYSDDANVVHELGLEQHIRIYNNTGSAISRGQPLYFTGNYENGEIVVPTVSLANATDSSKYDAQGLAASDIANGAYGYCLLSGQLFDFDTSGLTAGQHFYVGLTDGALQNASPSYPNYPVMLGWVVKSHATQGVVNVHLEQHSADTFRVVNDAHFGNNVIVDGDLTVNGTQTITSQNNISTGSAFIYLNSGDTIGEANTTFTGSGLDDAYFSGHYTGTGTTTYYVRIDGTGAPDTFEWSKDNFSSTEATGVAITGADQTLDQGISINFGTTTSHTSGDIWSGAASPANIDTGLFTNRNTGGTGVGYTHAGLFFDITDEKWKLVEEYDPSPTGTIDTSHASYNEATLSLDTLEAATGTFSTAVTVGGNNVLTTASEIALGTSTTGNYVATITGTTNEVEVTGSGSETAAVTVGLPSDVTVSNNLTVGGYLAGPASFTIDPASVGDNTGTVIIAGNLQVDGTTSGLDADTVDGIEGASLLRSDVADTKTSGDLNFADNVKATFGAGSDLQIYHDGSNSYIQDAGTGDLLIDGASVYIRTLAGNKYFGGSANIATLYHTNNPKLATTSTGVNVTGTITADGLNLGDGDFIRLGDATNGDFQIYHSGSDNHGYITKQQGAGHLFIENAVDDQDVIIRSDNGSGGVTTYFRADGSTGKTLLYKNGNEKLATTSTGIDVTGTITADGVEVTGKVEIEEDGAVNDRLLYLNSAGGLSGGQSGPFYGLYADIKSNNDATEAYGAYIKAQGGGGDNTYGIWAQATQLNSTKDAIGVLGKTIVASGSTNHGSERALGTGPAAGVYALAETTGTGTASQTTALHASNASTHGSLAYGAYIETISGPTTVVPLKVDHGGSEIFKVDSAGNATVTTALFTPIIDTTDSSAITITPAAVFSSDVTIENDLRVRNDIENSSGETILPSTLGSAAQVLAVNSAGNGVEWIASNSTNPARTEEHPTVTNGAATVTMGAAYTLNQIDVYLNGARMKSGTDYSVSSTTLTFSENLSTGDVVAIYAYDTAESLITGNWSDLNDVSVTGASANDIIRYDGGSWVVAPASIDSSGNLTTNGDLTVSGGQVGVSTVSTRHKYSVYGTSSQYAIGMQSGITFGGLADWGMTFQFNNEDDRGFWWGDASHSTAQGAMALTTNGKLTVAHSTRIGYGETDTTIPGATHRVDVNGSVNATTYHGDGSSLTGISAGATGGSTDQVFYENDQVVTTNYTISTNKNAMTAGPITVNSGVTITIPTGSEWSIV